jgi:molybdate transport system permease protein
VACRHTRYRLRIPLDRRGACLWRYVISAPGAANSASIEAVDRRLEQAASTLGAAPWRVFLTVTLPLALPGILAGMVLGFAKAIGEFGATITFVSNIPGETQTISAAIYSLTQTPDGDSAALRLVIVSIAIAMVALIASEILARRATARLHGY